METPFVCCIVQGKNIQLKLEEIVRHLYTARLINGYPENRPTFECAVNLGREKEWLIFSTLTEFYQH